MIRRDGVIQHAQAVALPGLKQPVPPALAVPEELEQEFLLVAAVRNMPDVARQKLAVGARHDAPHPSRGYRGP